MSLVDSNGSPIRGGKLLSSRQLTVVVDPVTHAMLNDLSAYNNVSVHDAATAYLSQAVHAAHTQLRFAKFLFVVSHHICWPSWSVVE